MTRVRTFRRASESRTTTATNMSIRDLPFTLRRTFISSDDAAGARSTLFGAEWIAQLKNGSEGNGPSVKLTSRGADGDDDGLEAESQDRRSGCRRCREHGYIERGVDQEGHEAEESPEAPRAVRARGEVPLTVQGVRCLSARPSALSVQGVRWVLQSASTVVSALGAKSAVGHKYASTVVYAIDARSAVGHHSASTVVSAYCARSAVGHKYASTVVYAIDARSAVGQESVSTVVSALSARSAVGLQSASTVVGALSARSAVGQEYASTVVCALECKECGGAGICEHGRQRHECKECGGKGICEHGRRRRECKECGAK